MLTEPRRYFTTSLPSTVLVQVLLRCNGLLIFDTNFSDRLNRVTLMLSRSFTSLGTMLLTTWVKKTTTLISWRTFKT